MTYLDEYLLDRPGLTVDDVIGSVCPSHHGEGKPCDGNCLVCWNKEIPDIKEDVEEIGNGITEGIKYGVENPDPKLVEKLQEKTNKLKAQMESDFLIKNFVIPEDDNPKGHIKDSGIRREFETGAVRDIQEGKGRCDLMPFDVVGLIFGQNIDSYAEKVFMALNSFVRSNDVTRLYNAIIMSRVYPDPYTLFLTVSKHFEEGAKKYGENNWRKGIPTHCYIDSAVRHYLKYLRGDKDEPHDRAFVWNILCCIWTCIHKPELNDYGKKEDREDCGKDDNYE